MEIESGKKSEHLKIREENDCAGKVKKSYAAENPLLVTSKLFCNLVKFSTS